MWALRAHLSLLLSCPSLAWPLSSLPQQSGPRWKDSGECCGVLGHVRWMLGDVRVLLEILGGAGGFSGDFGGCQAAHPGPWHSVFCPSLTKVQCHHSLSLMWGLMPPSLLPDLFRGSWGQHWGFSEEKVQVIHPSVNTTSSWLAKLPMP